MKILINSFVFLLFMQSCITQKARYKHKYLVNETLSTFSINGATLNNEKSVIGVTAQIISTGVGSYIGYKYLPIAFGYKEGKLNASSVSGAVFGGVAGYGLNNSFDYLLGNKRKFQLSQYNYDTWKKSFDPTNRFISVNRDYNKLEFVDKSYESNFPVRIIEHAEYFKKAFPQSIYSKSVFDKTLNISSRDYLPKLSKLFAEVNQSELFKKHLLSSSNIAEYKNSLDLFPENKSNLYLIEDKAVSFVKNYTDAENFRKLFPQSKFNKQVVLNALQECEDFNIPKLAKLFGSDFAISELDFKLLISNQISKKKYLNSQYILNKPQNLYDLEKLFSQYKWLNYDEKSKDALKYYWDVSYSNSSESTTILKTIENLYKDSNYKDLKISKSEADNFITEMLRKEVNKVTIKSTHNKGSTNPEWEKWLKNDNYSAGIVNTEGEIKYIIYGTIVNNSKFDLPIKITSTGTLISTVEIKGTGTVTNFLIKTIETLSGGAAATKQVVNLGNRAESFSIPILPKAQESSYAILLDFGKGYLNQGINFNDLIKSTSQVSLTDIKTEIELHEGQPSNITLKKQDEWQKLAKNGLPNTKLTDLWRGGKEVNDGEWRQEYSRILEARREAAAQRERNEIIKTRQNETSAEEQRKIESFFNDFELKFVENRKNGSSLSSAVGLDRSYENCPCDIYKLSEKGIFGTKVYDFYKDSEGQYWIFGFRQKGPFISYNELRNFIYFNK